MSRRSMPGKELVPVILEKVKHGGECPLVVTGHSMSPTLYHLRDKVYLLSTEERKPKAHDIVLFQRKDGAYVLHRILSVSADGIFRMNGDGQTWTETIEASQILAVVGRFERKGRMIRCDSRTYRFYTNLWIWLKPIRGNLLRGCMLLKRFGTKQ